MAADAVITGIGTALVAGSTSPAVVAIETRSAAEAGSVPVPSRGPPIGFCELALGAFRSVARGAGRPRIG